MSTPLSVYRKATSILSRSSDALPYAVVAAAGLALVNPSSFGWFRPVHYAPALGFLMFAVGVNLKPPSLLNASNVQSGSSRAVDNQACLGLGHSQSPGTGAGPPSLHRDRDHPGGMRVRGPTVELRHLPGAPEQAPLSIVLTALSTAGGVLLTPALALLLLGARLPVDAFAMAKSIVQIVLLPVAAGLALSTWVPKVVEEGRPYLASLALLDTCACVGASLASNSDAARSRLGRPGAAPCGSVSCCSLCGGLCYGGCYSGQGLCGASSLHISGDRHAVEPAGPAAGHTILQGSVGLPALRQLASLS
eukprot:jgi/Botrbrau1/23201/Bobra.0041s0045.1